MLTENTVAQILGSTMERPLLKTQIANTYAWIKRNCDWTRNIPTENLMPFAKWLLYQNNLFLKRNNIDPTKQLTDPDKVTLHFPNETHSARDYLADQYSNIKSKFNNPDYTPAKLEEDSQKWHINIASRKREPAAQGRIINLQGMPNGFHWVSLDTHQCSKEAKAMGHCGNSGGSSNDNIYSLRDNKNIAHLTFVVNKQVLGQSKGFGNSKPTKQYHPMIIPFLLGKDKGRNIVNLIEGGGFSPENNFMFTDLTPEQQEQILKVKPYINDFFGYLKQINKTKPLQAKKILEDKLNFYHIDNIDFKANKVILHKGDFEEMIEWLKKSTTSNLQLPDMEADWSSGNVPIGEAIRLFEENAEEKNVETMQKIINKMKKSPDYPRSKDYDIKWAAEVNNQIKNVLIGAADIAYAEGAKEEAQNDIESSLNNTMDDSDTVLLRRLPTHDWELSMDFDQLKYHLEEITDDYSPSFLDNIYFNYKPPYNGYEGFSIETYNYELEEHLGNILNNLQPKKKATFKEWLSHRDQIYHIASTTK